MRKTKPATVSHKLLLLVSPAPGKARWHCHLKRGFYIAKKQDAEVKKCTKSDLPAQRIGNLAQRFRRFKRCGLDYSEVAITR
jgi:hypothetical protein